MKGRPFLCTELTPPNILAGRAALRISRQLRKPRCSLVARRFPAAFALFSRYYAVAGTHARASAFASWPSNVSAIAPAF